MTSWATSSTETPLGCGRSADQRGDRRLVGEVEAVERLVEDQQLGAARPAPARSGAAAARRRTARRSAGARSRSRRPARSPRSTRRARPRAGAGGRGGAGSGTPQRAPSTPSRTRSTPRTGSSAVEAAALRQVADRGRAPAPAGRRAPVTLPDASGTQAEDGLHQGGLAGAVRAEHRDELAGGRRSSSTPPKIGRPADGADRGAARSTDRWRHRPARCSIRRSCATCHCWKRRPSRCQRLGDRGDRDVAARGQRVEVLDLRRGVLGVVDPRP